MLDGLVLEPSRRASLTGAVRRYETQLERAASYLERRGVTAEAAASFHLGVVSDPAPGHERFDGWLAFPYMTRTGPVAIKFGCMEDHDHGEHHHGKYDGPAGQSIRLYNAGILALGGEVCLIVEGEMDTIMASQELEVPTVGTWGTNWMAHYPRCFADFDRVVIVADNDLKEDKSNPGVKHARKVRESLQKASVDAEIILPPIGLDLSDWVLQEGTERVREALGL